MRTLDPLLSPVPTATSFGSNNTVYAQLFYDGIEQFFCQADTCSQTLGSGNDTTTNWGCSNLKCHCRPGTQFCGGNAVANITATINNLGGTLGIDCGAVDSSSGSASCAFKQQTLQDLFGAGGLTLSGCTFGECVRQDVVDTAGGVVSASDSSTSKSLGGGVIAGLAVIGALVLLSLLLLVWGLFSQRKARKSGNDLSRNRAFVEWSDLSYAFSGSNRLFGAPKDQNINNDKVVLDGVSGKVMPGQMVAILGPSGEQCFIQLHLLRRCS